MHDILQIPWPYPSGKFDHLVSCGVFHFLANLENIFGEAKRILVPGGLFAFTTRLPATRDAQNEKYLRQVVGEFEIYSHTPTYIESLLEEKYFTSFKLQKCFVGDDLILSWIARS